MLSPMDIFILCMPLAATILAVMKDSFTEEKSGTDKEEKPDAKKKITPFGVAAIFLALFGFGLSWYSTYKTKQAAQEEERVEADYRGYIKTALDKELPGAFSRAITDSQEKLNQSVSVAVDNSKRGLEAAIDTATTKSSAEVQSKIQSSGNAVASNLATAITNSQERINATLGITETKVRETIKGAETGISDVVKRSDEDIRKSVTGAVDSSRETITGVISKAVEAQTQRIGVMAEEAVGQQIMQIPLRIDQKQSGRLGGPLSDIIITVGDVSKDKPFDITVRQDGVEKPLYTQEITANKKGEWQKISFRHPTTNKCYELEVTVQTQRNLLGTGLDYVVVRARVPLKIARK